MMSYYLMLLYYSVCAILISTGLCSQGDFDPLFQNCLTYCLQSTSQSKSLVKPTNPIYINTENYNRYHWWDNRKYCEFRCIEGHSALRSTRQWKPLKYYGHWAFTRYIGLEEPASAIFSFGNAIPHFYQSYAWFSKKNIRLCSWVRLYPLFGILAWLSSTIYHCYKIDETAAFDYICALNLLSYGLWIAITRLTESINNRIDLRWIFLVLTAFVIAQDIKLQHHEVPFHQHMAICITVSVLSTILWIFWIILEFRKKSRNTKAIYICLGCQVWFIGASALEIFDFPPFIGIFDAHSLWHAATIPLGFLWYKFFEVEENSSKLI